MAGGEPSLYKTNWNKFEEAVTDVVRKEVCRVFVWLYQGGFKHVGQYLDEIPGGKAGLNKDEKATLAKREPPMKMDITLLYKLLQRTCGLAEENDPVWFTRPNPNSRSLEHTLFLIKKERNTVAHEGHTDEALHMSEADLDQKLRRLRDLCADLLLEASRRCGRESQADGLIKNMEDRLQQIQGVTADKFVLMAREERLKAPRSKMADEWYQQPLLKLQSRGVGLADLLSPKAADDPVIGLLLVGGEAGVGKSSLCRYLEECWLRPRSDGKDLLQRYRLVLRLHCRDICTCDALRLLKEELLPEAASRCSSDTLSEILRTVPILWLLDGLDEATDEATKLLSSLLRNKRPNSTVLVTSRPEFARDFLQRHLNDGIQLVSLLGADPREAIHRVIQSTKPDEDTARHAHSFMQEFERLDQHVQQELQNPLKLRLALHGWETMRTSTLRREFELGPLYHKITEAQIESLSEKLSQESPMTKSEATRKVGKWFSCLCESSFSLVQRRKVFVGAARDDFFTKLEDKCDDLKISSSKCLSTFLASPDNVFSTGNNSYTFYHDSQVHFLAARHIASVMKGSTDLLTDTLTLFNIAALQEHASEEPPLLHFLHVLLLLVSLTDASTPGDNTAMMIKLLLNAMPLIFTCWMWLDVARKASYEPKVMREIGKVMPEEWVVKESSIEAARKMLEYRQPNIADLRLLSKPEEVKEAEPFIHTLASLPIMIALSLANHFTELSGEDTVDDFLEVICNKESQCVLVRFAGHLGNKGYDLLQHESITVFCLEIRVKIKSNESFETFCERAQCFTHLRRVQLVIAMKEVPNTLAKVPNNILISVVLPYLTKRTAVKTAKFVARLSLSYEQLIVYDTDYIVIETFLRGLKKWGVQVNVFGGYLEELEMQPLALSFGPLPLAYPREEFRQRWSSNRSQVRNTRPTGDA